jgi:hypothetical protein
MNAPAGHGAAKMLIKNNMATELRLEGTVIPVG